MPMREECKHFQSRTYASGDVTRFCVLDLAPDAPWRCPENCPSFELRTADVGWEHGSLVEPAVEDEPESGEEVDALLDEAEDVVNAAAAGIEHEVETEREVSTDESAPRRFKSFLRRKRGGKGPSS